MRNRTRTVHLSVTLALLGVASVSDAQTRGGTLRVGGQADIVGLDPHTVSAASSAWVAEQIYDSLLTVTPKGEPAPSIAQKWNVAGDGLTYTFTLRPNVKFSNGKALTSKDVVYSLKRITNPKPLLPDRMTSAKSPPSPPRTPPPSS